MNIDKQNAFSNYQISDNFLDEVFNNSGGIKKHYQKVYNQFCKYSVKDFKRLNEYSKASFFNQGVTFAVYSDNLKGVERIFPFDLFPRIIPLKEWEKLEAGILQRNLAINIFIDDDNKV